MIPESYERKPKSYEGGLVGKWIYENGKAYGDINTLRIQWLVANYLKKINVEDGGWTTNYQDPEDGSYWQHTYPQGYMHGGGPPMLERITPITHAYKLVKEILQAKLTTKLYSMIEEQHHFESFGSRYIVWSNHMHLYRLIWDGKNGMFILERAHSQPLSPNTSWDELIHRLYNPNEQDELYVESIASEIAETVR